jgi:hypothetical protein
MAKWWRACFANATLASTKKEKRNTIYPREHYLVIVLFTFPSWATNST